MEKNQQIEIERGSGDRRVLEEKNRALEKEVEETKRRVEEAEAKRKAEEKIPPIWWGASGVWDPFWGAFPMNHVYPFPAQATVLQPRFFFLIQAWIPSPSNWTLRYRISLHGASNSTFHANCNGCGRSVTIIKSANGYFFGAYNPHSWTNGNTGWKAGNGSFLFTLTNPHGIPPTLLTWKQNYGAFDHNTYGPTFGNGHDIHVNLDNNTCSTSFPSSYIDSTSRGATLFANTSSFSVADLEVYTL